MVSFSTIFCMSADEPRRIRVTGGSASSDAEPQPSESDVVRALVEIEHAGDTPAPPPVTTLLAPELPWFARTAPVVAVLAGVVLLALLTAWGLQSLGKQLASAGPIKWSPRKSLRVVSSVDAGKQAELENLLERVAQGDTSAADVILSRSSNWTGKTQRTPKTDQYITADLNSRDMHAREAAIATQLAVDGIPVDQSGLGMLEQAIGNPRSRAWALWMLGALGNRGIDPVHTTTIIGGYLKDRDANVRASAVNGLALVGTDETVPMLLDRFRNDPSPLVQERAACALAESGMYTHQQRMTAAASLIGWLDDSLLTSQQRNWTVHALSDIAGQNFGTDAAAWRRWYESGQ